MPMAMAKLIIVRSLAFRVLGPCVFRVWALVILLTMSVRADEGVELMDRRPQGGLVQVKATFEAKGTLQEGGEQPTRTEMAVKAQVSYAERLIANSTANEHVSTSGARRYQQAKADIQVGAQRETVELSPQRATIVADDVEGAPRIWSPSGPLSRRELDLLESTSQSLRVEGLLPGRRVAPGEQWTHSPEVLAAFLQLDQVAVNEATSKFLGIEKGMARMRLVGTVKGSVDGAITEMEINGDYRYDTRWQRVTWLQLNLRESREQSATGPALQVVSELRMLIEPPAKGETASADNTPPTEIPAPQDRDLLLAWRASDQDLRLQHPRDWIPMDERRGQMTLRWFEGDKARAQCSVSRLKDGPAGKNVSLTDFQNDIRKALGAEFGEFERAKEMDRGDGYRVLRVAARGTVSELPIRWVYYHVTSPEGFRASLTFTMEGDAETSAAVATQERQFLATLRLAPSPDSRPAVHGEPKKGFELPPGAAPETARAPQNFLPRR